MTTDGPKSLGDLLKEEIADIERRCRFLAERAGGWEEVWWYDPAAKEWWRDLNVLTAGFENPPDLIKHAATGSYTQAIEHMRNCLKCRCMARDTKTGLWDGCPNDSWYLDLYQYPLAPGAEKQKCEFVMFKCGDIRKRGLDIKRRQNLRGIADNDTGFEGMDVQRFRPGISKDDASEERQRGRRWA